MTTLLQETVHDETLPVLFQTDHDPLALLNSPLSSDGDVSDIAYPSPLSSSGISEAAVSSPHQQQHCTVGSPDLSSNTFMNNNDVLSLAMSDDTLESILQQNTMSNDVKLDLG